MNFVGQQSCGEKDRPKEQHPDGFDSVVANDRGTEHTHTQSWTASWFCSLAVNKKRKRNLGSCSRAESLYTYPADHRVILRWIVAGNAQHPHERKQESPSPWVISTEKNDMIWQNRKLFRSFSLPFFGSFSRRFFELLLDCNKDDPRFLCGRITYGDCANGVSQGRGFLFKIFFFGIFLFSSKQKKKGKLIRSGSAAGPGLKGLIWITGLTRSMASGIISFSRHHLVQNRLSSENKFSTQLVHYYPRGGGSTIGTPVYIWANSVERHH